MLNVCKLFQKQGAQNSIFEGISEGVFIPSEYFEAPSKNPTSVPI